MCFSKAILSHNVMWCSPPDVRQLLPVFFVAVPSWECRRMASVLSLSGLVKHLFRLVVHLLSFRSSVSGSTASVFLNHASRDWGDVTVVRVKLRWTPRRLHFSSTAAIDYSHFPVGFAVKTLLFGRMFAKFEDLGDVWTCWSSPSVSRPEWAVLYSCSSRTSRSTSWLCSRVLYSAARLQKEVFQLFCGPRCCYKFPRNFSSRLMDPKRILRVGFVYLADYIASSILIRLVALSELSVPSGRAHP